MWQSLAYYPQVFGELALLHAKMANDGTPIQGRDSKNGDFGKQWSRQRCSSCQRSNAVGTCLGLIAARDAAIALLMRGVSEVNKTSLDDPALGQRVYVLQGSMLPALLDMFD